MFVVRVDIKIKWSFCERELSFFEAFCSSSSHSYARATMYYYTICLSTHTQRVFENPRQNKYMWCKGGFKRAHIVSGARPLSSNEKKKIQIFFAHFIFYLNGKIDKNINCFWFIINARNMFFPILLR